MCTEKTPSAELMKSMDSMIKPYAVHYYSKNDCLPEFRAIFRADPNEVVSAIPSIQDYFGYYELNYKGIPLTNEQKHSIANYFWDDYRTSFGREYDRIICTNSFRRLQYKTQVMVNSASDEQRTRLLHSLEVQRIAKKIALGIGANAELAENIAIAHDIGHAPFGHSGEEAISDFLTPTDSDGNPKDFDAHFLHAMQSVKVLDKIATHAELQKYGIDGLGLSDYVLEGVLKHDSDVFSEKITFDHVKNQYDVQRLCGIVGVDNSHDIIRRKLKDTSGSVFPQVLIGSIESQIVAWADKIAYLGHDWEEFLDTKLLEKLMSRLNDMVHKMFEISKIKPDSPNNEEKFIYKICDNLKAIEKIYDGHTDSDKEAICWEKAYQIVIDVINTIVQVEKEKILNHFTEKEYRALKDYFSMVISWVKLIDKYPKPEALKYDPIYIFYMYLSNVRTTVITKTVTEKLIRASVTILDELQRNECKDKNRNAYLLLCNEKWVEIYNEIQNDPDLQSKDKKTNKKRKKLLKDSVRTCYLVQFGAEDDSRKIAYVPKQITRENHGYYDFDDTYCCLLNIIGCIGSQYIGSTRVNFMAQQAQKIIKKLLEYYTEHPDMLPYSQRKKFRRDKNIEKITDDFGALYSIVDYVAGMTDRMAKKKYDEIMSSDTKWSNEYSSGLN